MKLSDAVLRAAKPKAKPYKLAREAGLYAVVTPNGSKLWRFAYSFAGKEKLLALGTYPFLSLAAARDAREAARTLLARGLDPMEQRHVEKARREFAQANTFERVAREWMDHIGGARAAVTLQKAKWMLETFAFPKLGHLPLTTIQPPLVLEVIREVEKRGLLETAHRLKARISEVFRFAIATGRASSDPCRDLRGALKPKPPTRHHAALTDPKQVGALLRSIDAYDGAAVTRAALVLAPILFVRPGELRAAQWPHFSLDGSSPAWRYYVPKTRVDHIVPLPTQAVTILRELHCLTGNGIGSKPDEPVYVFPNARTRARPMSENAITAALRAMGYTGDQVTGHGFRAMARTMLAELGWRPDAIERQLAHKPAGPLRGAYDRAQFLDERRKMMQAWADYLDTLKRGDESNVTPMLRAA